MNIMDNTHKESFMMDGKRMPISSVRDFQTIFAEEGCFYVDLICMFDIKGDHNDKR
jgi:hypothetical protein